MAYSNHTHLYYPDPITIPTSSPFYSTNTPLTTPSPNLCFNHGYTPHSPTPSLSPSPYATSTAYVHPYSPPPLTPSSSFNPYFSSATTPPNIYSSPPHSNPYSSYVSQQQPPSIQYSTFPSYPHHLHDPSYHSPQSFTYPPYSSNPNSTASPSPNHYTSYTTSSPSDYAYSNHYNYTQHPSYHTPFLPQQPNQTPNSNYLQHITTFHDQQISSKPAEISGKYKKEWEEYQRVFAEKLQAIRLAFKENLQKVSDKYKALKQSSQERLVTANSEKVEEEKPQEEEAEFTISGEEKESTEENKEEKKQEFKTYHDSLSQFPSPCPKLPPSPFPSTLSSPAPTPKSPDMIVPQFSVLGPQVLVPLPAPPPRPQDIVSDPNPVDRVLIFVLDVMTTTKVWSPPPPFPPPKPPDTTSTPVSTQKSPDQVLHLFVTPSPTLLQPPKPPDPCLLTIYSPPRHVSVPLPSTSPRPPPKPKYHSSTMRFFSRFILFYQYCSPKFQPPLDLFVAFTNESWTFNKTTICVKSQCPITRRHVALHAPAAFINSQHARDSRAHSNRSIASTCSFTIFLCERVIYSPHSHFVFSKPFPKPHDLFISFTISSQPFAKTTIHVVSTISTSINPIFTVPSIGFNQSTYGPPNTSPIFCYGQVHRQKSNRAQVSLLTKANKLSTLPQNSFGPPHPRPARKPPDLSLNLEDKVQVNPAAMIED
ncbi:unnamed protein product [Trifolium pratense]|uniref:Uncharacterized protein n=1 Tax=Trifolium pratense TaxID=57577 RepID=A0ACB0L9P8_TRIPR|nr:unnamed protein product [Trifolium pratense]